VREALLTHLDEIEDTYTALYRLEHPAKRWTLEELEQGLDLKK
jgi:RHH-type rel operon transcriptional repressor/antitoxin RelB